MANGVPAPLQLDSAGRIVCTDGFFTISYGSPWPSPNGSPGRFAEPAQGYVCHSEVGYEHSVVHEFEDPAAQASAFCSISGGFGGDIPDGHIEQYGPIGHGWMAWTQVAGNPNWRGHENEDGGDPTRPLTDLQLWGNAACFELESRVDGFPLQPTDDPINGRGLIFHSDGGAAWGGHDCPGAVRRAQRPEIIRRSQLIRNPAPPAPAPKPTFTPIQGEPDVAGWYNFTVTVGPDPGQPYAAGWIDIPYAKIKVANVVINGALGGYTPFYVPMWADSTPAGGSPRTRVDIITPMANFSGQVGVSAEILA